MIPRGSIPCLGRTELGLIFPICATLSGMSLLRLSDLQLELLLGRYVMRSDRLRIQFLDIRIPAAPIYRLLKRSSTTMGPTPYLGKSYSANAFGRYIARRLLLWLRALVAMRRRSR